MAQFRTLEECRKIAVGRLRHCNKAKTVVAMSINIHYIIAADTTLVRC
jgi:hypothetical protein